MEKRKEQKSSPESLIEVTRTLRDLFYVLKEHGAKLTDQDMDNLTRQFTGEVDEYIEGLLKRIKQARTRKIG